MHQSRRLLAEGGEWSQNCGVFCRHRGPQRDRRVGDSAASRPTSSRLVIAMAAALAAALAFAVGPGFAGAQAPNAAGSRGPPHGTSAGDRSPRSAGVGSQPAAVVARSARAARLLTMGRAMQRAGDRASAMAYYREVIAVDPRHGEAYAALGAVYLERAALDDARRVFETGLSRRPDQSALWRGLAEVLERGADLEGAAAALRSWTSRLPRDPSAHRERALFSQRRGAFSEALASYRALIDLAAQGDAVPEAWLGEAERAVAALRILVGELDPLGRRCSADDSALRAAIRDCSPRSP